MIVRARRARTTTCTSSCNPLYELVSYKDQLKKTHAEAEAARKRGVELAEPHKAALEQNKQISDEMRALPHTQQLVRQGWMSILDASDWNTNE